MLHLFIGIVTQIDSCAGLLIIMFLTIVLWYCLLIGMVMSKRFGSDLPIVAVFNNLIMVLSTNRNGRVNRFMPLPST